MPKCERCSASTPSADLQPVVSANGRTEIVCKKCREEHICPEQNKASSTTGDRKEDCRVVFNLSYKGISFTCDFSLNGARKFFAETGKINTRCVEEKL